MSSRLSMRKSQSSDSMNSSTYGDTSIGSSSIVSSKNERLKFLRKPPLKRAVRSFINLYSYLFSVLPVHSFIYDAMFCVRLIQLFLPSIFYTNKTLFLPNTMQYNVGVFLTVFIRLFPVDSSIDDQLIFGIIYVVLFFVYTLVLGSCAYYFVSKSTLPSFVPSFLSILFTIFEHFPHCFAMAAVGNFLAQETISKQQIAVSSLLIITFSLFSIIHQMLNISTIFFTPLAFKTVHPWPQSALTYITAIICFLSEFSGHYVNRNKIVTIVLMCVVFLLYCFLFYLMEIKAIFLNGFQGAFYSAVNEACLLSTVISIIYVAIEKPIPDFILVIVVFFVLLTMIINFQNRSRWFIKSLQVLDMLEEDKSAYSMFKNTRQLLRHVFVGFQTNHRYCLSYTVFRDSLNIFENDLNLLAAFAKLLAIYPEEYAQLNWVFAMIKRYPKKTFIAKYIKAQLMTILMRRESTLSHDLKKKLQSISNLVTTAKLRIRNTWEAVLSGTIAELEPLFISYSAVVKQIDLKFTYLQNYHSNNQYALRALSNYERDVQANIEMANFHREKVKKIKMGRSDDIDQVYLYGRIIFPMLPNHPIYQNFKTNGDLHALPVNSNEEGSMNSYGSFTQTIDDEEHSYLQDAQTRLRHAINSMSVPSIRVSIALSFFMIILIMILPFVLIFTMINPIEKMISEPVTYVTSLDRLHKSMLHLYGLTCRWVMEAPPFNLMSFCENDSNWIHDGGVPKEIGGDCRTNSTLFFFAQEATAAMDDLTQMKRDSSSNPILTTVKNTLFHNITQFQQFFSFALPGPYVNMSVQQYVMDSVETAIQISETADPSIYATSRQIVNLLMNAFSFEAVIVILTDKIIEYLIEHTTQIKDIFTILEITLSIFFPVTFIVISIIMAKWVRTQKRRVFRCFYALPKTTLSKMIESTNTMNATDAQSQATKTDSDIEIERQEDKAITTLRSADIGNKLSRIYGLFVIGFFIVILNIAFVVYSCQYFITNSVTFIHSSPLLKSIGMSYCDGYSALLFLTILAWKDNGFNYPFIPDEFLLSYFSTKLNTTLDHYNLMFYGNFNKDIFTSARFVDNFSSFEIEKCVNQTIDITNDHTMYRCLSYDSMYNYYIVLLKKLYFTYPFIGRNFDLTSSDLFDPWHIVIGHLYPKYFNPLMNQMKNSVEHVLTSNRPTLIIVLTILLVMSILVTFYYTQHLFNEERELKNSLLLLLHAPPNEIFESSYIMTIISGDFSLKEEQGSQVDEAVYNSIITNYPDALVLINSAGSVITMNQKAVEYLCGEVKVVPKEVILNHEEFIYAERSINASYNKIDPSKTLVLLRDMSKTQELEQLLSEETKRKANLVSRLMPSILTPKVMALNSNKSQGVSFSVQSVTITMISLCLNGHDEHILASFNEIHTELISLIKRYHTIESVEIFGDVFMIVGGLFDEVNQAERHAREIIKFALEAIDKITAVKKKYCFTEPTLCGVATGGPISGGVLELDVPIFEICGDIVDLADAMMVQGVPNVVHTTRSVYELIYGRDFQIKERGELSIPNFGTVVTYIVSANISH